MIEGINIFQNYYIDPNPQRQEEIEACRSINAALCLDTCPISYRQIDERMTYNQVFRITEQYPNHLNIIANSDIYFEVKDLKHVIATYNRHPAKERLCFALTRWDLLPDNHSIEFMNRADSQDTWMFYGAVPQIDGADFYVGGVAGCDNKIAYLLALAGFQVCNPSLEVRTIHIHNSNIRNYIVNGRVKEQLPPPYKLVPPCTLRDVLP